jgi:hypothetical protein
MKHRALGAMLITAPTEAERVYEMSVKMASSELRAVAGHDLAPWLRVKANIETGEVVMAAGIRVKA